jgi:hypothetical protein
LRLRPHDKLHVGGRRDGNAPTSLTWDAALFDKRCCQEESHVAALAKAPGPRGV